MTEFDSFAHDYEALHGENVRASGFHVSYFDEYKIREVAAHLARLGWHNRPLDFLNFGCGIGKSELFVRERLPLARVCGVDVSAESIAVARQRNRALADVSFAVFDGHTLPFDAKFDVAFVANVFHHVARSEHTAMLRLLHKSLKPGGLLFFFEHNPLNPITVKTIRNCPFDKDAVLLPPWYARRIIGAAGFRQRTLRFTLFFPKPLAALLPLEKYLRKLPLGAQYYFVARKGETDEDDSR